MKQIIYSKSISLDYPRKDALYIGIQALIAIDENVFPLYSKNVGRGSLKSIYTTFSHLASNVAAKHG